MKLKKLETTEEDFRRSFDLIVKNFATEHDKMGSLSASGGYNFEKGVAWWKMCVECGAWAIEDDEGNFVASIGVYEDSPWYSDSVYLADGWFYVLPEYRYKNVGTTLVEVAKDFAKQRGLPLMIAIFNPDGIEEKIAAFQRMGMKLASASFMAGE